MADSPPDREGVYYRPLRPSDEPSLQQLHARLFPLDYDQDFFSKAVAGADGIVAWAAAAPLPVLTYVGELAPQLVPPSAQQEWREAEVLAGFITARAFPTLYADPHDRDLLGLAAREADQEWVLYVLTLGVAEAYQHCGIARRLLEFALRYAAETACRAVYLHVAEFNTAAQAFYAAAGFRQLAVLPGFYTIRTGRQPQPV
ncbi:histone acetyltransferase MCC1-like isoform B [Micractinium conductrix]|uniref:N-alpha-acetyltransferase 60 n=1 Tax=Micractinium conductrix TaxID=554055 RepID=A0A2P6VS07_9CHLO|nr:histone acetyltransferase MCC1-like isoform A [Micractinium conductrix]PSC76874.1 histone acetyltransferase MCC1-like isoform B [Micractinium conductrix]|eukprot:PSC76873.1 histone acetyltransferase MCC1-like isoform A [Micractinium conductrix]